MKLHLPLSLRAALLAVLSSISLTHAGISVKVNNIDQTISDNTISSNIGFASAKNIEVQLTDDSDVLTVNNGVQLIASQVTLTMTGGKLHNFGRFGFISASSVNVDMTMSGQSWFTSYSGAYVGLSATGSASTSIQLGDSASFDNQAGSYIAYVNYYDAKAQANASITLSDQSSFKNAGHIAETVDESSKDAKATATILMTGGTFSNSGQIAVAHTGATLAEITLSGQGTTFSSGGADDENSARIAYNSQGNAAGATALVNVSEGAHFINGAEVDFGGEKRGLYAEVGRGQGEEDVRVDIDINAAKFTNGANATVGYSETKNKGKGDVDVNIYLDAESTFTNYGKIGRADIRDVYVDIIVDGGSQFENKGFAKGDQGAIIGRVVSGDALVKIDVDNGSFTNEANGYVGYAIEDKGYAESIIEVSSSGTFDNSGYISYGNKASDVTAKIKVYGGQFSNWDGGYIAYSFTGINIATVELHDDDIKPKQGSFVNYSGGYVGYSDKSTSITSINLYDTSKFDNQTGAYVAYGYSGSAEARVTMEDKSTFDNSGYIGYTYNSLTGTASADISLSGDAQFSNKANAYVAYSTNNYARATITLTERSVFVNEGDDLDDETTLGRGYIANVYSGDSGKAYAEIMLFDSSQFENKGYIARNQQNDAEASISVIGGTFTNDAYARIAYVPSNFEQTSVGIATANITVFGNEEYQDSAGNTVEKRDALFVNKQNGYIADSNTGNTSAVISLRGTGDFYNSGRISYNRSENQGQAIATIGLRGTGNFYNRGMIGYSAYRSAYVDLMLRSGSFYNGTGYMTEPYKDYGQEDIVVIGQSAAGVGNVFLHVDGGNLYNSAVIGQNKGDSGTAANGASRVTMDVRDGELKNKGSIASSDYCEVWGKIDMTGGSVHNEIGGSIASSSHGRVELNVVVGGDEKTTFKNDGYLGISRDDTTWGGYAGESVVYVTLTDKGNFENGVAERTLDPSAALDTRAYIGYGTDSNATASIWVSGEGHFTNDKYGVIGYNDKAADAFANIILNGKGSFTNSGLIGATTMRDATLTEGRATILLSAEGSFTNKAGGLIGYSDKGLASAVIGVSSSTFTNENGASIGSTDSGSVSVDIDVTATGKFVNNGSIGLADHQRQVIDIMVQQGGNFEQSGQDASIGSNAIITVQAGEAPTAAAGSFTLNGGAIGQDALVTVRQKGVNFTQTGGSYATGARINVSEQGAYAQSGGSIGVDSSSLDPTARITLTSGGRFSQSAGDIINAAIVLRDEKDEKTLFEQTNSASITGKSTIDLYDSAHFEQSGGSMGDDVVATLYDESLLTRSGTGAMAGETHVITWDDALYDLGGLTGGHITMHGGNLANAAGFTRTGTKGVLVETWEHAKAIDMGGLDADKIDNIRTDREEVVLNNLKSGSTLTFRDANNHMMVGAAHLSDHGGKPTGGSMINFNDAKGLIDFSEGGSIALNFSAEALLGLEGEKEIWFTNGSINYSKLGQVDLQAWLNKHFILAAGLDDLTIKLLIEHDQGRITLSGSTEGIWIASRNGNLVDIVDLLDVGKTELQLAEGLMHEYTMVMVDEDLTLRMNTEEKKYNDLKFRTVVNQLQNTADQHGDLKIEGSGDQAFVVELMNEHSRDGASNGDTQFYGNISVTTTGKTDFELAKMGSADLTVHGNLVSTAAKVSVRDGRLILNGEDNIIHTLRALSGDPVDRATLTEGELQVNGSLTLTGQSDLTTSGGSLTGSGHLFIVDGALLKLGSGVTLNGTWLNIEQGGAMRMNGAPNARALGLNGVGTFDLGNAGALSIFGEGGVFSGTLEGSGHVHLEKTAKQTFIAGSGNSGYDFSTSAESRLTLVGKAQGVTDYGSIALTNGAGLVLSAVEGGQAGSNIHVKGGVHFVAGSTTRLMINWAPDTPWDESASKLSPGEKEALMLTSDGTLTFDTESRFRIDAVKDSIVANRGDIVDVLVMIGDKAEGTISRVGSYYEVFDVDIRSAGLLRIYYTQMELVRQGDHKVYLNAKERKPGDPLDPPDDADDPTVDHDTPPSCNCPSDPPMPPTITPGDCQCGADAEPGQCTCNCNCCDKDDNRTPGEVLQDATDNTPNSSAGADLLGQTDMRDDDTLASVGDALGDMIADGNNQGASDLMAAVAGSTVTSLGAAQRDAMRDHMHRMRWHVGHKGKTKAEKNLFLVKVQPVKHTSKETPGVADTPAEVTRRTASMWVEAVGSYSKLSTRGNESGYRLSAWGGAIGADREMSDTVTAGLSLTALYGDLRAHVPADSAKGDLDTYYLSVYAKYKPSFWGHTFMLTGSLSDASLRRTVNYGKGVYSTAGSTDGYGLGAMYEISYDIYLKPTQTLQFFEGISAAQTVMHGYTESGAGGASLRVGRQEQLSATLTLGARWLAQAGRSVFGREADIELFANIAQDLGDSRSDANVALMANPGYARNVRGARTGSTAIQFGGSISVPVSKSASIYANANADLRERNAAWNASAGLRIGF